MGSCISKCNPQKNPQEDDDHHHECVKDKLVISQAPISPRIPLPSSTIQPRKLVSSSPSSSSSSCSVSLSSFSSTATNVTLSSSLSSSSSSSSSSYFKDRSFSNDFLLSCAQEHDHILDIKKNKVSNQNTSTMFTSGKKYLQSPSSSTMSKQPSPRRECNSTTTPKKRPRANSPIMVRQKSFRKELDQQLMIKGGNIGNNNHTSSITSTYHFPSNTRTTLKSPSPSRRFPSNSNGDHMKESSFRNSKGNNGSVVSRSSSLRRENHFTPKNEGKMRNHVLPISPKIDEMEIGEVKSNDQKLDSFLMEDINNPLIALDCFIFL
ncbi:uncharacterized protein LOC129903475 [Solanum dulcamara]|uniref:uncharacterized protein LOC129903475 n=1 Tax=Solanum dulcamara TaxID=45834 RepID=UPI002486358D|nr:uncharacterized protein LOC129903475 [Solanum dulcamara]